MDQYYILVKNEEENTSYATVVSAGSEQEAKERAKIEAQHKNWWCNGKWEVQKCVKES
jgi:hypothetical protein